MSTRTSTVAGRFTSRRAATRPGAHRRRARRPSRARAMLLGTVTALVVALVPAAASAVTTQPGSPTVVPNPSDFTTIFNTYWTAYPARTFGFRDQYNPSNNSSGYYEAQVTPGSVVHPVDDAPGTMHHYKTECYGNGGTTQFCQLYGYDWNAGAGSCHFPVFYDRWGVMRDTSGGRNAYVGPDGQTGGIVPFQSYTTPWPMAEGLVMYYNTSIRCHLPDVAKPDSLTVAPGSWGTVNELANDTWYRSIKSLDITAGPGFGSAVVNSDDTISWFAPDGLNAATSLTYRECDWYNECATGTVTLNRVVPPPAAAADTLSVDSGSAAGIFVTANDTYTPAALASLTLTRAPGFGQAQLYANGYLYWNPGVGTPAATVAAYRLCDVYGRCSSANITLKRTAPKPTATAATMSATGTTPVSVDLASSYDLHAQPLTSLTITQPPAAGGTLSLAGTVLTWLPPGGTAGQWTTTYQVCSPGGCANGQLTLEQKDSVLRPS